LSGGIAERLEQVGDCWVFLLQSERRTRQPDRQKTGAEWMLACNERSSPSRTALLGIVIGEERPFIGYAVDVGRPPAHHAVMVGANLSNADVIGHDDENVRFLLLRLSRSGCRRRSGQHGQNASNQGASFHSFLSPYSGTAWPRSNPRVFRRPGHEYQTSDRIRKDAHKPAFGV
jgi:hypothetical protein